MTVPRPTPLNFDSRRSGSCRVRQESIVSITLSPSGTIAGFRGEDGRIFSGAVGPGPTREAPERSLGLVKFRQSSHSHQAVPAAREQREHRKYRHKAGTRRVHRPACAGTHPGLFRHDIIIGLRMAVLASYSWTGFVVKNSHVASPGIQSQGGRGGTGRARMERPLAIANGEIATVSGPER